MKTEQQERRMHSALSARTLFITRTLAVAALAEYLRCLKLPGAAHGLCEDYRASAGIDLEHDRADAEAGRQVECEMLALWGADGAVGKCFQPLEEWRKVARRVTGHALPSGHYIAEEVPEQLLAEVLPFLRG